MVQYSELADHYDERYTSQMCKSEDEAVKYWVGAVLSHSDRVLDVGCGTGYAVDKFPAINPKKYTGVDSSLKMISKAREKHPEHFFHWIRAEFIAGTESYDVAMCLFSIPYIGTKAVRAIYDALKPGGYVVCVSYKKPYLNPSSVYGGQKWRYLLTVDWRVRKVLRKFRKTFNTIIETPLIEAETYTVSIFKKEVRK